MISVPVITSHEEYVDVDRKPQLRNYKQQGKKKNNPNEPTNQNPTKQKKATEKGKGRRKKEELKAYAVRKGD